MRRTLLALACCAVLLSGCGTATSTPTASLPSLSLLPSADPYHSAVVATRAMGTARTVMDVTYGPAAGGRRLHAEGATVFPSGSGRLTWSGSSGAYQELVNDQGIFVSEDDDSWTEWTRDDHTATSAFADTLRGLNVLRDVTASSGPQINGVSTTQYSGWIPVDAREAALVGLESSSIGDDARELIDVWVDDFGHIVKVQRQVKTASGAELVTVTASFTDFALLLDLSPPTNNVTTGTRPLAGAPATTGSQ